MCPEFKIKFCEIDYRKIERFSKIFISFLIFQLYFIGNLWGQEIHVVEAEGTCIGANITFEEGQKMALDNARAEAIKKTVGVNISEETFRRVSETMVGDQVELFDAFSKLSKSTSYGRIIKEEIVDSKTEVVDNLPVYKVKIKAEVIAEEGKPDPDFTVEIIMDKDVFFDRGPDGSDEISFDIWASQDCYIYLFNLMANDSIQLILPNNYIKDNFYSVQSETQVFMDDIRSYGMTFPVKLSPGRKQVLEAFYIVALKDKIPFETDRYATEGDGVIPTYRAAFTEMQNWLVNIPIDRRTEAIKTFEIRKQKR